MPNSSALTNWHAPDSLPVNCSPLAAVLIHWNGAAGTCSRSWIRRPAWLIQSPRGCFLDPQGTMTLQPEQAWLALDPAAMAARVQQLGIDLTGWRMVPIIAQCPASQYPRQWRITL